MCTLVFLNPLPLSNTPLTVKFWKLFLLVIYVTIVVFLIILITGKPKRSINNNNLHSQFINWLQVRSHNPIISILYRINHKFSYIATIENSCVFEYRIKSTLHEVVETGRPALYVSTFVSFVDISCSLFSFIFFIRYVNPL